MILNFLPPKKNQIMFYDLNFSLKLAKLLKIKYFSILHTRKEFLNIYILFKSFLKFKFSFIDYLQEYINYCSPKILITFTDNDSRFYKLKCLNGHKVFIQNGKRTKMDIFFYLKKVKNQRNFHVDYMFVHNKSIAKEYSKFIKGRNLPIGSVWSNEKSIKKSYKKNFIYISTFRPGYLSLNKEVFSNILFKDYIKNEIVLLKQILKFCKLNNIKLEILAKYHKSQEEHKRELLFFKQVLGNEINFLPNYETRDTFSLLDSSNIIIGVDSTLAYEAFARNKKVAFFSIRGKKNSIFKSRKFAWPYKVKDKGFFWTNKASELEVTRVFNNLLKTNFDEWNKMNHIEFKENIMCFDSKNKKLKYIINKLIGGSKV